MKNVQTSVDGNILTIKIDLTQDFGPSKSGKTQTIASTLGNKPVSRAFPDVRVGVNVYRKL